MRDFLQTFSQICLCNGILKIFLAAQFCICNWKWISPRTMYGIREKAREKAKSVLPQTGGFPSFREGSWLCTKPKNFLLVLGPRRRNSEKKHKSETWKDLETQESLEKTDFPKESGASWGAPHGASTLKVRKGAFDSLNRGSGALGEVQ